MRICPQCGKTTLLIMRATGKCTRCSQATPDLNVLTSDILKEHDRKISCLGFIAGCEHIAQEKLSDTDLVAAIKAFTYWWEHLK